MTIKTFRGLLNTAASPAADIISKIRLKTRSGSTGYKIVKFSLMATSPSTNMEGVVKIYSVPQASGDNVIDFSDPTLIAAGLITQSATGQNYPEDQTIYFDNIIVNQDMFIYSAGGDYDASVNYYLEMEVIKLKDNENEYVTLKDLKQTLPQHG